MVDLVPRNEREERIFHHAEPLEIMNHHTQLYGPAGDQSVRRFKIRDTDHWYLFDPRGRAVARVKPEVWAKAVAGV